LSRDARRFDFVLFAPSKCRKPGVRRMSLPLAVSLNRFATDFLVFCMEVVRRWESAEGECPRRWSPMAFRSFDPPRAELGA
jgi:hypothetical protein